MAIKKRTAVFSGSVAQNVGLGAAYGEVLAVELTASADTSVSLAVTDANTDTVATIASGNYTTRTRRYIVTDEAVVADTAGEAAAANAEGTPPPVAKSPLTITPAGLGSGTLTVNVYVRV